jgi:hypothetical protein
LSSSSATSLSTTGTTSRVASGDGLSDASFATSDSSLVQLLIGIILALVICIILGVVAFFVRARRARKQLSLSSTGVEFSPRAPPESELDTRHYSSVTEVGQYHNIAGITGSSSA